MDGDEMDRPLMRATTSSSETNEEEGGIDERLDLAREAYRQALDISKSIEDRIHRLFTGIAFVTTGAIAFGFSANLFAVRYDLGTTGLPLPGFAFLAFILSVVLGVLLMLMALVPSSSVYWTGTFQGRRVGSKLDSLEVAEVHHEHWKSSWLSEPLPELKAVLLDDYIAETRAMAFRTEYKFGRMNEAKGAFTLAFTFLFLAFALEVNALVRLRFPHSGQLASIDYSKLGSVPWVGSGRLIVWLSLSLSGALVAYESYRAHQNVDSLGADKYWTSWRRHRRNWLLALAVPIFEAGILFQTINGWLVVLLLLSGVVVAEAAIWQKWNTGWQYLQLSVGGLLCVAALSVHFYSGSAPAELLLAMTLIIVLQLPRVLYSSIRWHSVRGAYGRRREQELKVIGSNPWLRRHTSPTPPITFAHQGGATDGPSNTILAVNIAADIGIDAIEIDVHATRDQEVVVIHDKTLDRTTNAHGRVRHYDKTAVCSANAAYWWVRGKGVVHTDDYQPESFEYRDNPPADCLVPTLESLLEIADRRNLMVAIEIKDPVAVEGVIASIRKFDLAARVILTSFYDTVIHAVRRTAPELRVAAGRAATVRFIVATSISRRLHRKRVSWWRSARRPYFSALQIPPEYTLVFGSIRVPLFKISRYLVDRAHELGIGVHVWTIDDSENMNMLIEMGVDGIMTDCPGVLVQTVAERWPAKSHG